MSKDQSFTVCALYKFVNLVNYKLWKPRFENFCISKDIKGTILLAHEGINGTVAGKQSAINELIDFIQSSEEIGAIDFKLSFAEKMPFYRLKIKLKKEIVTMGMEDVNPNYCVGTYIEPKDWNSLIKSSDVVLIDTRNQYEYNIGTFKGAINPQTSTFREFPEYVNQQLDKKKHKKIAMFCTGGIRCEKSTAYLKQIGFDEVYHLKGGILKYLEEVSQSDSLWQGDCFVFDQRVSVKHGLQLGEYDMCYGCRYPINEADKASEHYIDGVSCPHCYDKQTDEQKMRFLERQKQIELAQDRGEKHFGEAPSKCKL